MTEEEMGRMSAHIEAIREDISQLKTGHAKMIELMVKLTHIEDKFIANDESHKILWDRLNRNSIASDLQDKVSTSALDTTQRYLWDIAKMLLAVLLGIVGYKYGVGK